MKSSSITLAYLLSTAKYFAQIFIKQKGKIRQYNATCLFFPPINCIPTQTDPFFLHGNGISSENLGTQLHRCKGPLEIILKIGSITVSSIVCTKSVSGLVTINDNKNNSAIFMILKNDYVDDLFTASPPELQSKKLDFK